MAEQEKAAAMRAIAARTHGYRCCYCRVPTAATIEHVQARTKGGRSGFANLMLACPYCNRRKNDRPLEQFMAEEGWRLHRPDDLPGDTLEMLRTCFGWDRGSGLVATGSTNSKLEIAGGQVLLMVRAHKRDEWRRFQLGDASKPAVSQASWDFLKRHDTPAKPKRRPPKRRPPKRAFAR